MKPLNGPRSLATSGAPMSAVLACVLILTVGACEPTETTLGPGSTHQLSMQPLRNHITRSCRRAQMKADFVVLCPSELPQNSRSVRPGLPPGPVTARVVEGRGSTFGVEFVSSSLHFAVLDEDSMVAKAPDESEALGVRALGGRRGPLSFASPHHYSYHSGHLMFSWAEWDQRYTASLHAAEERPTNGDVALMDKLIASLMPASRLPQPPRVDRMGRRGSRLQGFVRLHDGVSDVAVGGGSVWATNYHRSRVARIDPARPRQVVSSTRVPRAPLGGIALHEKTVWVVNADRDSVTQLSTESGEVSGAPADVGDGPHDLAMGDRYLWVLNRDNSLSRIDPAVGRPLGSPIDLEGRATRMDAGRNSIWVIDFRSGSVIKIDQETGTTEAVIPVGGSLGDIEVAGRAVWVSDYSTGSIHRIDPDRNRVKATISVGDTPAGLDAMKGNLWVVDTRGAQVHRIDMRRNRLVESVDVGVGPLAIAVDSESAWIADADRVYRLTIGRADY